jgi:catechol 2,3-dioxygenase-like lactoylglutathione lyase family enzyme
VFERVRLRAQDLDASVRFYRLVLGAIGLAPGAQEASGARWQELELAAAGEDEAATRGLHLGFVAGSREQVDGFWAAGTAAGHPDDGAPGERPYRRDYYGAFLLDPDGNSAEAVCHGDTRRGGCLDHLWIGVAELEAAERFYQAISRHTGLREGRRWEQGVQFRGAWATFSLVADGRPPSRGVEIAFPAPDREAVEGFHAAALGAGARSLREPAPLPGSGGKQWSACVLDPAGTRLKSLTPG